MTLDVSFSSERPDMDGGSVYYEVINVAVRMGKAEIGEHPVNARLAEHYAIEGMAGV